MDLDVADREHAAHASRSRTALVARDDELGYGASESEKRRLLCAVPALLARADSCAPLSAVRLSLRHGSQALDNLEEEELGGLVYDTVIKTAPNLKSIFNRPRQVMAMKVCHFHRPDRGCDMGFKRESRAPGRASTQRAVRLAA